MIALSKEDVVCYEKENEWEPAVVVNRHGAPRSYNIRIPQGFFAKRNQRNLKYMNEPRPELEHYIYR